MNQHFFTVNVLDSCSCERRQIIAMQYTALGNCRERYGYTVRKVSQKEQHLTCIFKDQTGAATKAQKNC